MMDEQQRILPLFTPACDGCPYWREGKCDGPESPFDILPSTNRGRVDCLGLARILEHHENLRRHRPPPFLEVATPRHLPDFIPVLESGLPNDLVLPVGTLYGVSLKTVIGRGGTVWNTSPQHLRRVLRLPENARLCLITSADDRRIENFWKQSALHGSWQKIAALNFEFATGMAFSVWPDNARANQRINIDRLLASVDFLAETGLPVVPLFFCARDADYRQAQVWLRERPNIGVVAGLATFHKNEAAYSTFLDAISRIRDAVDRDLKPMIIGAATMERIGQAFDRLGEVVIVSNKPVRKGASGHMADEMLRYSKRSNLVARGDMILANICRSREFCRRSRIGERSQQIVGSPSSSGCGQGAKAVPSASFDGGLDLFSAPGESVITAW